MHNLRRFLRAVFYLPIRPANFRLIVWALRSVGWLPGLSAPDRETHRILIAQPYNSLGDLVLSLPFLDKVHREWPGAEIDVVVGNAMAVLFRDIPYIRKVVKYTPTLSKSFYAHYIDTFHLLGLAHHEMEEHYDFAFDPRWDSDRYAFLARALVYLSGASVRVGYSGCVDRGNSLLDGFLTHRAVGGQKEHESIRKLRLLDRAGLSTSPVLQHAVHEVNETFLAAAQRGKPLAEELLQHFGIQNAEQYVVLSPSASHPIRFWPAKFFGQVMLRLHEKHGLRVLLIGDSNSIQLCGRIAAMYPGLAVSVAGKTNIRELIGIVSGAMLFVGNDSGPAHVSGMLGRNTVVISPFPVSANDLDHPNAPRRFHPCGPCVRVLQPDVATPPCDPICSGKEAHCITKVSVDRVFSQCEDLLRSHASASEMRPFGIAQENVNGF